MKFTKVLNETASFEYGMKQGFQPIKSNHPKFPGLEDEIIKSIMSAFRESEELRVMYGVYDNVHDIEVTLNDSIVDISFHPENGQNKILGHFPMSYVSKYLKSPKDMVSFLMMKYKK